MSDYVVTFAVDRDGDIEHNTYTVTDVPSYEAAIVVASFNAGVAQAGATVVGKVLDADALRLFGSSGYVFSYFTREQGGALIASFIPAKPTDDQQDVYKRILAAIPGAYRVSTLLPYKLGSS